MDEKDLDALHERIGKALGWEPGQTKQFSLPALRDMLREKHPKLHAVVSDVIQRGQHLHVQVPAPRRRTR